MHALHRSSLLLALLLAPLVRAESIYERLSAANARGAYTETVALADDYLARNPRDGHVLVRRGLALSSLGRHQDGALTYARAHAVFLRNGDDVRTRAIALTNLADDVRLGGDPVGALADAFAAKLVDPAFSRAPVGLADAWYDLGNLAEANAFLAQAQKLEPGLRRTFTAEGAQQRGAGRTQPNDKANTNADFTAANAAYASKEYVKAVALYDRVVALQPGNAGAWGNRGNALYALKRYPEAVLSHTHAAVFSGANGQAKETARHLGNRSNSWLALEEYEAALVDCELATTFAPDFAFGWSRLAAAAFAHGDAARADSAQARARELDPAIAAKTHDPQKAATNALRRRAASGDRAALAELVDRAAAHQPELFEGNPARTTAIAVLDRLLALTPQDATLLVLRARAENTPEVTSRLTTAEGAFTFLDRAIAAAPESAEAHALRGIYRIDSLLETEEEKATAYADLDRAITLGTTNPEAFARRAGRRSELKDFRGAQADLTAALALAPDDRDLLRSRTRAATELRDWDTALADHARLVALGERGAFGARAETLLAANRLDAALADFDLAIRNEPKNPEYHLGRARAHRLLGHRDAALADHRRARELDPLLPELAADLANADQIEALRNDFDHAMARAAVALRKVNDATTDLLKAELEKQRAEDRLERMFTGEDRSPEQILDEVGTFEKQGLADGEDYRDQARALAKLERRDEALAALSRAIALDGDDAEAFNLRGRLHEAQKDLDLAFADYDRAVALAPQDPDYLRDRGDIWWERENFEQALADYEAAVAHGAKNAANWFKRGNARLALGRFDDAIADYDEALKLDPELTSATKNRALAQRRKAGS